MEKTLTMPRSAEGFTKRYSHLMDHKDKLKEMAAILLPIKGRMDCTHVELVIGRRNDRVRSDQTVVMELGNEYAQQLHDTVDRMLAEVQEELGRMDSLIRAATKPNTDEDPLL